MSFIFELVSPDKLLFSKPVVMVTAPGYNGEYGVLAGHAPAITELVPGVIGIYEQSDHTLSSRVFVTGGFAEISADKFTVLARNAIDVSELNKEEIAAKLKEITERIKTTDTEEELKKLDEESKILTAKLQAAA